MEALEYEKARIRMCQTIILKEGRCSACPLYDGLKLRCMIAASVVTKPDEDAIKKNVDKVIKWAKDHPVKTRQSEFLKIFPNTQMNVEGDVIWMCPKYIDENHKPKENCHNIRCSDCKRGYWLEEVSE